jgi:hypothetical protein
LTPEVVEQPAVEALLAQRGLRGRDIEHQGSSWNQKKPTAPGPA